MLKMFLNSAGKDDDSNKIPVMCFLVDIKLNKF